MLLKHFSFDVEYVPGKKNQLPDDLFKLSNSEVFREDPEEADAFLPPTRLSPEGVTEKARKQIYTKIITGLGSFRCRRLRCIDKLTALSRCASLESHLDFT
jgi:hypothetical protein